LFDHPESLRKATVADIRLNSCVLFNVIGLLIVVWICYGSELQSVVWCRATSLYQQLLVKITLGVKKEGRL
jgi:hypothetical protein